MTRNPAPLLDFKHLRVGQVYRVRRAFLDAELQEHHVGEEWTYLDRRSADASTVTLLVRDSEGHRRSIPLGSGAHEPDDLLERLSLYLTRIPEVAAGHQFLCDCELGHADWAEVYASSHQYVLECFRCGAVIAIQKVSNGSRMLALDDEARAAVRAVSALPAKASFEVLLQSALEHRSFPANVMLGAMLARRPNLETEFADAMRSEKRSLRLAALEFVSQMTRVPEGLEPAIVHALKAPLDANPLGDETRWALEALLNVADRMTGFRSEIAELRRELRRYKTEEARRGRLLVQAILAKMDERIRTTEESREAAVAVLRKLAVEKAYAEAVRWLGEWADTQRGDSLVMRAQLAEAAGDGLSEENPEAAQWLHERALNLYQQYCAGQSHGEAAARGRHVRRVGRKLGMHPSSLPPAPERHAVISTSTLAPPRIPSDPQLQEAAASEPKPASLPRAGIRGDLLEPQIEIGAEIPVGDDILALVGLAEAELDANRGSPPPAPPRLSDAPRAPAPSGTPETAKPGAPMPSAPPPRQPFALSPSAPPRPRSDSLRPAPPTRVSTRPVSVPPRPGSSEPRRAPGPDRPLPSKPPTPPSRRPPRR